MTISGSSPLGGAARVANAYGINPRAGNKAVTSHESRVTSGSGSVQAPATRDARPVTSTKAAGIPLSSVLNDEERAYFDQLESMGPITYGRTGKGGMVPDAPRGVRLDVRG